MNRTKKTQVIAATLVCISAVASAQTTYTFTDGEELDHSWHSEDNWFPTGVPGAGDTAIIPAPILGINRCEIYENDAACKIIQIDGTYNELVIQGKTLTLGENAGPTTSTIDGMLDMLSDGETPAVLALKNWVTLEGDHSVGRAVIDASKGHGSDWGGQIIRASGALGLRVRGDLQILGSVTFIANVDHRSSREILVTDAADTMIFGTPGGEMPQPILSGNGSIVCRMGLIEFRRILINLTEAPDWTAGKHGTIEVTNHAPKTYYRTLPFDVTAEQDGTLIFNHVFESFGKLRLSHDPSLGGATVIVRKGYWVHFGPPPN